MKPKKSPTMAGASDYTIPLMRPQLPTSSQLAPYLAEIDANRWYTNFGPLVLRFEKRLAANGTTALSAALMAVGARPGSKCLVPTWTFVASAAAIWAANLTPHFIDVSSRTWEPDPDALRRRSDLGEVGAVMVVSPFGSPVNARPWDEFWSETGIPVIIDAAAAFDTVASLDGARPGRCPVMISLHATKAFGVGEGGLVLSTSEQVIHRLRQVCNFGIWGSEEGQILGYNGKLSEYHAAVGLAALDGWAMRRTELMSRTLRYSQELKRLPSVALLPAYGDGWVSVYCTIQVPGNVPAIVDRMASLGVETRRWWQDGVHVQPAYRGFPSDDLPVSADIAAHALSLPFSHDISDEQITYVVDSLARSLDI
jgi:dTDP-4-amino-4,6-dideoxygalactose transaminase